MVFVGIFMMPFYYGSRARSVPEYLKLRFDEKTRGWNAITFAVMTVFSSGISMFVMAKLIETLHIFDGLFDRISLAHGIHLRRQYFVTAADCARLHFLGGSHLRRFTTKCCSSF